MYNTKLLKKSINLNIFLLYNFLYYKIKFSTPNNLGPYMISHPTHANLTHFFSSTTKYKIIQTQINYLSNFITLFVDTITLKGRAQNNKDVALAIDQSIFHIFNYLNNIYFSTPKTCLFAKYQEKQESQGKLYQYI